MQSVRGLQFEVCGVGCRLPTTDIVIGGRGEQCDALTKLSSRITYLHLNWAARGHGHDPGLAGGLQLRGALPGRAFRVLHRHRLEGEAGGPPPWPPLCSTWRWRPRCELRDLVEVEHMGVVEGRAPQI